MSEVASIEIPNVAVGDNGTKLTLFGSPSTRTVKLGAIVRPAPMRVPRLSSYVSGLRSVQLPASVNSWSKSMRALARMYLNDRYGCCVISGKYHQLGAWSGSDGAASPIEATDAEVQQMYNLLKAGPGDSGCVIADVLDYFQKFGLPTGGTDNKIDGYVSVNNLDKDLVKLALYLFGSLTIGINLPSAWANNAIPGGTWDVTSSASVGGHDVCCVGYNDVGVQISTWGIVPPITITWAAFTSSRYIDECYAQLAPAWYGSDKLAPCGVQVDRLKSDLELIRNGGTPNIDPPAPVPPVPPSPSPVIMRGKTDPFVVVIPAQTITFPAGAFGRQVTATIPERRCSVSPVPVTVSDSAHIAFDDSEVAAAATEHATVSIPWALVAQLVLQFGKKALPVIVTDVAAGNTFDEIVRHLIQVFVTGPG